MSTTTAPATPRPLPLNTIIAVKGVSHRQDTVHQVVEGDEVVVRHDTLNPHDVNACAVETLTGDMLGYVPRELAARLAVPHPGGRWRARVHEVFRKQTWGLRIKLGPMASEGAHPTAGADNTGTRDRVDAAAESSGHLAAVQGDANPPGTDTGVGAGAAQQTVRSGTSRRTLGTLVAIDGSRVIVVNSEGRRAAFPKSVVAIDEAC